MQPKDHAQVSRQTIMCAAIVLLGICSDPISFETIMCTTMFQSFDSIESLQAQSQCVRRKVRAVGRKAKRRKAKAFRLGSKISGMSAKESECRVLLVLIASSANWHCLQSEMTICTQFCQWWCQTSNCCKPWCQSEIMFLMSQCSSLFPKTARARPVREITVAVPSKASSTGGGSL